MDDILRNRVEKKVRKALLSSVHSDKPSVEKILSLSEKEFSFLVDQVYSNEIKAITIAFREKQSIVVPAFGFFKFRPNIEPAYDLIRSTVRKYGYNTLSEIKDPSIRKSIEGSIGDKLKQIYLDTRVVNKKVIILGNIFKK